MDEQRKRERRLAIETIAKRSGLAANLGNKVLRASGGLGGLTGSAQTRVIEAMGEAARRRVEREIAEVFEDDEILADCARWFEGRAAGLFREVEERLADTASPFALLEDALADPRMPERYRELQRARPKVLLAADSSGRPHPVPRGFQKGEAN